MPISTGTTPGPRSYATPDEYATWAGLTAPPADVDNAICARASELVDDHIVTAVYATTALGYPTDAAVAQALGDAVCAQVEFWRTGDEEDDILGPLQSVSTQGVQLQYGAGPTRATPMYLAPRAARILRAAGLLSGVVRS